MTTEQRWLNEHGQIVAGDGPLDLAEHAAAAQAAAIETPGWWRRGAVETYHVFCQCDDGIAPQLGRVLLRMNVHFQNTATAEHIARNPPAVTLALIQRIEELESALRQAADSLGGQDIDPDSVEANQYRVVAARGVRL